MGNGEHSIEAAIRGVASEGGGRVLIHRRRRTRRSPPAPLSEAARQAAPETPPEAPRAGTDLDGLLRDLSGYRLSLDAHLTVAAAAVEHADPAFAIDLVDGGRRQLADTERRLLARLAELELERALGPLPLAALIPAPAPEPTRQRAQQLQRRAERAAPLVGALAVAVAVFFGGGPLQSTLPRLTPVGSDSAISSWTSLRDLAASKPDAPALIAASSRLHQALQPLIASAPTDPAAGKKALGLLTQERQLLQADQPAGSDAALAATQRLVNDLTATLSRTTQAVLTAPSTAVGAVDRTLELLRNPLSKLAPGAVAGLLPAPPTTASPTPSSAASPSTTPSPAAKAPAVTPTPHSSTRPAAPSPHVPPVLAPPIRHLLSIWQQLGLDTSGTTTSFRIAN